MTKPTPTCDLGTCARLLPTPTHSPLTPEMHRAATSSGVALAIAVVFIILFVLVMARKVRK